MRRRRVAPCVAAPARRRSAFFTWLPTTCFTLQFFDDRSDAISSGGMDFALARIVTSDPCGASATNRSTAVFALAFHPANNIFIGARVAAAAFPPAADVSNASMCSLWLPLGGHPLASALVTSMFEL